MKVKIKESDSDMKVIGTYINKETYEELKLEAEENFLTISSLLKKIIYTYIRNKEKEN